MKNIAWTIIGIISSGILIIISALESNYNAVIAWALVTLLMFTNGILIEIIEDKGIW